MDTVADDSQRCAVDFPAQAAALQEQDIGARLVDVERNRIISVVMRGEYQEDNRISGQLQGLQGRRQHIRRRHHGHARADVEAEIGGVPQIAIFDFDDMLARFQQQIVRQILAHARHYLPAVDNQADVAG